MVRTRLTFSRHQQDFCNEIRIRKCVYYPSLYIMIGSLLEMTSLHQKTSCRERLYSDSTGGASLKKTEIFQMCTAWRIWPYKENLSSRELMFRKKYSELHCAVVNFAFLVLYTNCHQEKFYRRKCSCLPENWVICAAAYVHVVFLDSLVTSETIIHHNNATYRLESTEKNIKVTSIDPPNTKWASACWSTLRQNINFQYFTSQLKLPQLRDGKQQRELCGVLF